MIDVQQIPNLYLHFRNRWTERDERMIVMDSVVKGDFDVLGPDDQALENRSPNLIQVGIEDTSEAASTIPTARVTPSSGSDHAKGKAAAMERLAASYMDLSQYPLLNVQSLQDLVAFGFHAWVVTFDKESGSPVIEWRDPRFCFPEPGYRPGDSVRRCIFAREVYLSQLPAEWAAKIEVSIQHEKWSPSNVSPDDPVVMLVELFTEEEILVVGMYRNNRIIGQRVDWTPVQLERTPTPGGICPVVLGQRITVDREPRGQFDQVVNVLQAHVRLMGLVLDYADQAVYSDVWVKDLVGQMPYGGGSFIQLGPQGGIGRVPPATSSFAVEQQMQQLVDNIHLGGRWPKSRPGEIDQAIASAKFVEATAGMMNTVIRTLHLIMARSLEQALRICFKVDHEVGAERTIAGVLKNQQFLAERKKSDIDLKARVRVDYGIALGRDVAQAMVLGIQGMQNKLFSREFVQENFDGISNVAQEQARIDTEQLTDMAMALLLQGLQSGTIPQAALIDIAKERANGKPVFELYEKYVIQPQQEMQEQMIPDGLGGDPMMPGADPNAAPTGGPQPPAPPEAAGLLAALAGGGGAAPPPGAPATESIGRLSVPLPGGGFAGTQNTAG